MGTLKQKICALSETIPQRHAQTQAEVNIRHKVIESCIPPFKEIMYHNLKSTKTCQISWANYYY